jgi:hypothetical protein
MMRKRPQSILHSACPFLFLFLFLFLWLLCSIFVVKAGVVINEIHFEPADPAELSEFIELHNPDAEAVDLSGWELTNAVDFTFAQGTSIAPDGYLLIAKDPAGFKAEFGGDALGPWTGGLNNSGESIELEDAAGTRIDRVDYRAGFPWPTLSAGRGGSMELIHPDLDNDLGSSWRYSKAPNPLPEMTLLREGSESWRYRLGGSEASESASAWRQPDFVEDASWSTGASPLGFGD